MRFRSFVLILMSAVLAAGPPVLSASGQGTAGAQQQQRSDATPIQRLEVMRSRLETMRRTLNSAIAALNTRDAKDKQAAPADDAGTRLRGLEKETGALLSEVSDIRSKQERAERYDVAVLERLEASVGELNERVEAGLRATAGERRSADTESAAKKEKKKPGFFGRLLGRGGDDKYEELVGTVAPGRDRQLFEEATAQARKDNYETARDLYNVIITTYPESAFLRLSKLAIADTFYLEGTTSALIQAAQAYQDWLTFFPTDPLADDVMLKIAEVEMRKMGLPDRDVTPARKAEQRLKVLLQQFPNTSLRPDAEIRLREVQENLATHNKMVGDQYFERYFQGKAPNPKGAQSRYREIVEKYPNYSRMDEVLYRLAVTYVQEEEPDEAAKYFQQLLRNYPNSERVEKAREQLDAIGAAKPDPDPTRVNFVPPPAPSMREKFFNELLGTTPVTVDKNGILISSKGKDDLIEEAIRRGGTLPATVPTAPINRTPPARPLNAPPTQPGASPSRATSGVTAQPTRPGPPRTGSDPTNPAAAQPSAPAAQPPAGIKP